jgi:hypothetical protein
MTWRLAAASPDVMCVGGKEIRSASVDGEGLRKVGVGPCARRRAFPLGTDHRPPIEAFSVAARRDNDVMAS